MWRLAPACPPLVKKLSLRAHRAIQSARLQRSETPVSTAIYVEEVVVDQAVRGQHISTGLMRKLLELAAQKGLRFVELTSRPTRNVANNLYLSLGFKLRETNCCRHNLDTFCC